jgi:hypothetical protein
MDQQEQVEARTDAAPDQAQTMRIQRKLALEHQIKSGTNWFFFIAGLSLVNSIIYLSGGTLNFVVGLGITQFIDGFTGGLSEAMGGSVLVTLIGLALDLLVAGAFVAFGVFARRKQQWALITGMILYALDGLFLLALGSWFAVAFHAFALWGLWRGLQALRQLLALDAEWDPTVSSMKF